MARLLHDFNTEFGEETPGAAALAERVADFIETEQAVFLLAGEGPDGIAQMRYFPSLWTGRLDAYLEELYVVPSLRGGGIGRALLATLAAECVRRGLARLEWAVLDWNEPSIGFYRLLGAVEMDEWTVFRLDGAALAALGREG